MRASRGLRCIFSIFGFGWLALLAACGGSSSGPPPNIRIAIHPAGASVVAGSQTQQFSATVNGDPNGRGVT